MNITVFGGNSNLGFLCIQQALRENYAVKAFLNDNTSLDIQHFRLMSIQGNISETHKIEAALIGADAVIYILDWEKMPNKEDFFYFEKGILPFFESLRHTNAKQFIAVLPREIKSWLRPLNENLAHLCQEISTQMQNLGLRWTLVENPFSLQLFSKKWQYKEEQNALAQSIVKQLQA